MPPGGRAKALLGVVVAQIVIFVLSLPGVGIEPRKPSDYMPWAGPIFLALTVLVFVLGAAALASYRSHLPRFAGLAAGQAIVAVATNLLDFSGVGGPRPPTGPLYLGVASIVVSAVALGLALQRWTPPEPSPAAG